MKTALIIMNLLLPLLMVATFFIHDAPPKSSVSDRPGNGVMLNTVPAAIAKYNARCDAYRSLAVENVSISVWQKKLKLHLTALVYFEKDRNCRMTIKSPLGKEGDIGSNKQLFWIWGKRLKEGCLYANHTDNTDFPIEYRPAVLCDSLGLIRLNMDRIKISEKKNRYEVIEPIGDFAKVFYINKESARLDAMLICNRDGKAVFTSEILKYDGDCPVQILYRWEAQEASAVMDFTNPKLNVKLSSGLWDMPNITPKVNLAK